jgi:tetratricopeptide (TPR) repeat protein
MGRQLRPESIAVLERSLGDRDPLVRLGAVEALAGLEPLTRWRLGAASSGDPVRAVRLEAARTLSEVPAELQGGPHLESFEAALDELRASLRMDGDRSQAQLWLGSLAVQAGNAPEAERAFRRAIEIDSTYAPAYVNLSDLLRSLGRDGEGEQLLRDGLEHVHNQGGLHHALGLLLVRQGRRDEALVELERAAELRPDVARYGFVFAVALEGAGEGARAIEVLTEVHELHPGDVDVLSALIGYHRVRGEAEMAARYADKLSRLGSPIVGS